MLQPTAGRTGYTGWRREPRVASSCPGHQENPLPCNRKHCKWRVCVCVCEFKSCACAQVSHSKRILLYHQVVCINRRNLNIRQNIIIMQASFTQNIHLMKLCKMIFSCPDLEKEIKSFGSNTLYDLLHLVSSGTKVLKAQ